MATSHDPSVDVVVTRVLGGVVHARKVNDEQQRPLGPEVHIGDVEEFGYRPKVGEVLCISEADYQQAVR